MEFPRARREWHILVITQGLIIYPQTQPRPPFYTPLYGLPHPFADVFTPSYNPYRYSTPLSNSYFIYYLNSVDISIFGAKFALFYFYFSNFPS